MGLTVQVSGGPALPEVLMEKADSVSSSDGWFTNIAPSLPRILNFFGTHETRVHAGWHTYKEVSCKGADGGTCLPSCCFSGLEPKAIK